MASSSSRPYAHPHQVFWCCAALALSGIIWTWAFVKDEPHPSLQTTWDLCSWDIGSEGDGEEDRWESGRVKIEVGFQLEDDEKVMDETLVVPPPPLPQAKKP